MLIVNAGQLLTGHAVSEDKLVMIKLSPLLSVSLTGYVPEGVIVVPVPKLVQVVMFIAQPGGTAHPKKHALQSCVVLSLDQVKGEEPLVAVISPFDSWHAVNDTQFPTTTDKESLPQPLIV